MAWTDMIPFGRSSRIPVRREAAPEAVSSLQYEVNRLFDRFFDRFVDGPYPSVSWPPEFEEWKPSVDISETDDEIQVSAGLPGVEEKDIEVSVGDGSMSLKGSRSRANEDEGKEYRHREQYFGSFQRVIPLPATVDADAVEATYEKGVLHVTLPKRESSRPTRVAVSAS